MSPWLGAGRVRRGDQLLLFDQHRGQVSADGPSGATQVAQLRVDGGRPYVFKGNDGNLWLQ
jgi:hypothetical protein